ncbi:hypothetical protein [Psychromonas ossibalaenae]|uniref:hypothetical protein n=1 Tax=Psychromonas ossibalaenae TaxID=444922 RepID=UPI00036AE45D|nr:hypothetical protein [Psychromonas ossibalaenae]
MKLHPIVLALGLIPLTGCGGGSSSETTTDPVIPEKQDTYTVRAVDGYLRNAQVWLDLNGNFALDDGEPSSRSGIDGITILDVGDIENPQDYQVIVKAIASETVDQDTISSANPDGIATTVPFILSAPAGQTVVTPLSTLVNIKIINGTDPKQAAAEVAADLGIDETDLLGDYIAQEQGDIAAKANAIVELAVLPESEQAMQDIKESSSDFDALLSADIAVVQELKEDQRLVKEEDGSLTVATNVDTDDDGVIDAKDAFPEDKTEWLDTDKDGTGNNADLDDDGDKVNDDQDAFPLNAEETTDTDGDGTGNNADLDDDGDKVLDKDDAFPLDKTETLDTDGDDIGNNADTDDDGDKVLDQDDAFPLDKTETVDTDGDGTGNNADTDDDGDNVLDADDAFPLDKTETLDTDGDDIGNNTDTDDDGDKVLDKDDALPLDKTETIDTDGDGIGNNADLDDDGDKVLDSDDAFPLDNSESLDSDKDGVGDNADAYKDDAQKSVLDSTSSTSYRAPVIRHLYQDAIILDVEKIETVAAFNNGDIQTTSTTTYISLDSVIYGVEINSDLLSENGSFSRIKQWSYDYNLDGETQFFGQALDIGNRTADGETFLSYVDEGDASAEDPTIKNGNGRIFDDIDFTSRSHPADLSKVDTIQSFTISWSEGAETKTITTDFNQYPVSGFDRTKLETLTPEYAFHSIEEAAEDGLKKLSDQRDWQADGTINQSFEFTANADNAYIYTFRRPVWADPTDGMDEEYADYNHNAGKADMLTSYWFESTESLDSQGIQVLAGKRYVLNTDNEANIKLVNADNPEGLLFHEYSSTRTSVSDTESNELVSWTHHPLSNYDFTADTIDPGQAYKVYQKQNNGIWVGYSFPEWGSQSVVDLAEKIEDVRSGGTPLADINEQIIAGLSRYNLPITSSSFIYDEQGSARTWYFVSNNSIVTNGQYSLNTVTLADNGFKDGWLVLNSADQFFLLQPNVEEPWNWFDAYQRHWLGISSINTETNSFMWSNWLGEFYLNESQAETRLAELQASESNYFVCYDGDSGWDEINQRPDSSPSYQDFLTLAEDCNYTAFNTAEIAGLELDFVAPDDARSYSFDADNSGIFQIDGNASDTFSWEINSDGILEVTFSDGITRDSFALTAAEGNKYSVKGFFQWQDDSQQPLSGVYAKEFYVAPEKFSIDYLTGKTLYVVWFGDGDLVDENGNAVDENGDLIPEGGDEFGLTDVAVVQEVTYNSDGKLSVKGLKNSTSMPDSVAYHYVVDDAGILRIPEEQDEATEGNIICDNSHPDYLKTHFILSDNNGVEQFDNVDLFFFDKQTALDYANGLNSSIAQCTQ